MLAIAELTLVASASTRSEPGGAPALFVPLPHIRADQWDSWESHTLLENVGATIESKRKWWERLNVSVVVDRKRGAGQLKIGDLSPILFNLSIECESLT